MAYFKCTDTYDPIFGNASLGNLTISENTNLSELQVGGQSVFPSFDEDNGMFELNCNDFTLNENITLTADKRNAGIIIRCTGNCTISGSILNNLAPKTLLAEAQAIVESKYPSWMVENGSGGKGGEPSGSSMNGRIYGGGIGGGGAGSYSLWSYEGVNPGGAGGAGGSSHNITTTETNIFIGGYTPSGQYAGSTGTNGGGGSGGGGSNLAGTVIGGAGGSGAGGNGGAGSHKKVSSKSSYTGGGGGGAGNWGGGVVIIICRGNLTITGTLNCNGQNGGAGGGGTSWYGVAQAGGNGGGGRIYLLYKNEYTNSGSCSVSSGDGTQGVAGNAGDKKYTSYRDYKAGNEPTDIPSVA